MKNVIHLKMIVAFSALFLFKARSSKFKLYPYKCPFLMRLIYTCVSQILLLSIENLLTPPSVGI